MRFIFKDRYMARIWSAFVLSVFAVSCVCSIKFILDQTPERVGQRKSLLGVMHRSLMDLERQQQAEEEEEVRDEEQGDSSHSDEDLIVTDSSEAEVLKGSQGFNRVWRAMDQNSVNQLMTAIVRGFSVLVGLVWDISFEAAESVIVAPGAVSGNGFFKFLGVKLTEHPVAAKCVLCVILIACVLPVWREHIVPFSRRHWWHHFLDVKREEQRNCKDLRGSRRLA